LLRLVCDTAALRGQQVSRCAQRKLQIRKVKTLTAFALFRRDWSLDLLLNFELWVLNFGKELEQMIRAAVIEPPCAISASARSGSAVLLGPTQFVHQEMDEVLETFLEIHGFQNRLPLDSARQERTGDEVGDLIRISK